MRKLFLQKSVSISSLEMMSFKNTFHIIEIIALLFVFGSCSDNDKKIIPDSVFFTLSTDTLTFDAEGS